MIVLYLNQIKILARGGILMKRIISILFGALLISAAVLLSACTNDSADDQGKGEEVPLPMDSEVALFSGDSEIRLKPSENGLNITYLSLKSSENSFVSDTSVYTLPKYYWDEGLNTKLVEITWQYNGRSEISSVINNVPVSGYKFNFTDTTGRMTLDVSCIARENLDGPFEFVTDLTNISEEDIMIVPDSFSSLSLESLSEETTVFTVKKESGMAQGYVHYDGTTFPGKAIKEDELWENLNVEAWVNTYQSFNSSGYLPMVYVNNNSKNGIYAALEWSSGRVLAEGGENYSLTLSVDMDNVAENDGYFRTNVPAGDTFVFPSVYYGVYDGSIDDGSNVFKAWFFDCKAPDVLRDNTNEPQTQMDMQIGLDAADISVEAIKWDYGWWTNEYADNHSWKTLEGSWQLRNDAYIGVLNAYGCRTLAEFGQLAKEKGLSWTAYLLLHDTVDVNLEPVDEFGEFNSLTHPEWFGDRHITTGRSADLGNEECVEYLKTALTEFFSGNNITTWRSDFEPISFTSPNENRHRANGSDVMYWCTVGFRDIIQHLYDNVDGFRYESCSSGGSMKDLFTATQAVVINCDDSANYLSLRTTFYDSSYVIHPAQLQLPINADTFNPDVPEHFYPKVEPDPIANAENWKDTMLDMGYRTMMLGTPMFSSWSGTIERDYIKQYSEMYQEKVRPLVRDGELYHILPRPDGKNWDGVMYADPDSSNEIKGAVFLFKPNKDAGDTYKVVMDGLDSDKEYSLVFEDRAEQNSVVSGSTLMSDGIDVQILGVGSEIIWIYEAE